VRGPFFGDMSKAPELCNARDFEGALLTG